MLMSMLRSGVGLLGATLALSASAVSAQDFSMPGTSPMDMLPQSQALTSSVIGNLSVGQVARSGGRAPSATGRAPSAAGRAAVPLTQARLSDATLPYASTPATRRQAVADYMSRLQKKNPKAAAAIGPEFRRQDVERSFTNAVRPYGLRTNDAADVMTAFLMVGWEIITGGDPSAAQVRGVRRQVAGQLVGNPSMRDPALRTRFAEELKITFFVLAGGMGSAQRDGDIAQYRRGVSAFYRAQTGEDIGRWRLTPAGFRQ